MALLVAAVVTPVWLFENIRIPWRTNGDGPIARSAKVALFAMLQVIGIGNGFHAGLCHHGSHPPPHMWKFPQVGLI